MFGLAVGVVIVSSVVGGAIADRIFGFDTLDSWLPRTSVGANGQKVLVEESVTIDIAERVSPSVVTVSVEFPQREVMGFDFFQGFTSRFEGGKPQDIGSGFIVSRDGLIVTNKHVVSVQGAIYKVITSDDKEYEVTDIKRDPANDLAIIKIDLAGAGQVLQPVELGDSSNLKVGQYVMAIGTALGEFRHTVTTGVISGLGRGITAGSAFEGYVEELDDVVQTDAAINPGNSGGPLLNSAGQVIGINVAIADGAENIGFAIPINVLKEALNHFETDGSFASKPFLGVEYQMISKRSAIVNEVPEGAYIASVVAGSGADKAGIKEGDIITKFGGEDLNEDNNLASAIKKKKVGDSVEVELWRGEETLELSVILSGSSE
ncbi:MAG: Protease Do [Candidatus Woesebacteria bacterium GW2011_GWB1_43_14]|uniref:Protease Do n=1 Tax=Candidatus Woesebacteria bacterium GW2011_GWB1_43_14 TaxID=1618578 RepID=A0A0G1DGG3_9BACT|nr:MAG: protease Do [Candidatus Woesebacteria bacterium GW2011_GWC1_42_9]KKS96990.1 MAG: Protease Do [Candidatus Woesebacteria bacterium GW2011_GWB1_43_14]